MSNFGDRCAHDCSVRRGSGLIKGHLWVNARWCLRTVRTLNDKGRSSLFAIWNGSHQWQEAFRAVQSTTGLKQDQDAPTFCDIFVEVLHQVVKGISYNQVQSQNFIDLWPYMINNKQCAKTCAS